MGSPNGIGSVLTCHRDDDLSDLAQRSSGQLGSTTSVVNMAPVWPPIQTAYDFVHYAAHLLANHDDLDGAALRQAYQEQVLALLRAHQADLGSLASAATHFARVTASYWPGLFHCDDVADLPRTNNDLEQYFAAARHLERRATGRKMASPAMVVRGAVRLGALMATRPHPLSAQDLQPRDVAAWKALRQRIDVRHELRRRQTRFRRDPATYLTILEAQLLKPVLPP
jgi:hypothetical protein